LAVRINICTSYRNSYLSSEKWHSRRRMLMFFWEGNKHPGSRARPILCN
jgi:hypothetical protein